MSAEHEGQRQYGKRGHQTQACTDCAIATTLESRDRRQQRQVERDEGAEDDQDRNVAYRRVRRVDEVRKRPDEEEEAQQLDDAEPGQTPRQPTLKFVVEAGHKIMVQHQEADR
jgi:hypothetical protein